MKKIKIFSNWSDNVSITKRFKNNFITENNYEPRIVFTFDNDYDIALVFNYTNEVIDFTKTLCFIQEPSFSTHIINSFLKKCNKVFFHDKTLLPELNNIVETPIMMFNHFDENINDLLKKPIKKSKKMSMIASSLNGEHNYGFRYDLFKNILETPNIDIDLYGQNWGYVLDKRFKGYINNKLDGILDYEFSIAIENKSENGYTSEKFTDLIINETIPIYYGNNKIDLIYNKNGYIKIEENNVTYTLNLLRDVIKNYDYNEFNNGLLENKFKILNEYNIYCFLKKILF